MAMPIGLRQVKVTKYEPSEGNIVLDSHRGTYSFHEVTNDTESEVDFVVNDNPQGGRRGVAIPIKAGTTRKIPMALYSFSASGTVTVVSYGM